MTDEELHMTDEELEQFFDVRFERLGSGRYAVFGQIMVGDKLERRRASEGEAPQGDGIAAA